VLEVWIQPGDEESEAQMLEMTWEAVEFTEMEMVL